MEQVGEIDALRSEVRALMRVMTEIRREGVPRAIPNTPRRDLAEPPTFDSKVEAALAIYSTRRKRDRAAGRHSDLFADPAWDIMLDLYIAAARNERIAVSSACVAGAVPPTTGLRWIKVLIERGLIARELDPWDRRRCYVVLTPDGRSFVDKLLP